MSSSRARRFGLALAVWTLGCAASIPTTPSPTAAQARRRSAEPPPARVVLAPPDGPEVSVEVELARTEEARRRGLMGRRYLRRGHGMLFVYPDAGRREFWMRNTYVRLDMIFIDAARSVIGVVENPPPLTDELRAVDGESQYVLEVGAGFARDHGIVPGTAVRFENVVEEP